MSKPHPYCYPDCEVCQMGAVGMTDEYEKIARLLRLVGHMDRCIKAGGPRNYTQFIDPLDLSLITEARQIDDTSKGREGDR